MRYRVDETQATTQEFRNYAEAIAYAHTEAVRTGYASEVSVVHPDGFYLIALVYPDGSVSKVGE